MTALIYNAHVIFVASLAHQATGNLSAKIRFISKILKFSFADLTKFIFITNPQRFSWTINGKVANDNYYDSHCHLFESRKIKFDVPER